MPSATRRSTRVVQRVAAPAARDRGAEPIRRAGRRSAATAAPRSRRVLFDQPGRRARQGRRPARGRHRAGGRDPTVCRSSSAARRSSSPSSRRSRRRRAHRRRCRDRRADPRARLAGRDDDAADRRLRRDRAGDGARVRRLGRLRHRGLRADAGGDDRARRRHRLRAAGHQPLPRRARRGRRRARGDADRDGHRRALRPVRGHDRRHRAARHAAARHLVPQRPGDRRGARGGADDGRLADAAARAAGLVGPAASRSRRPPTGDAEPRGWARWSALVERRPRAFAARRAGRPAPGRARRSPACAWAPATPATTRRRRRRARPTTCSPRASARASTARCWSSPRCRRRRRPAPLGACGAAARPATGVAAVARADAQRAGRRRDADRVPGHQAAGRGDQGPTRTCATDVVPAVDGDRPARQHRRRDGHDRRLRRRPVGQAAAVRAGRRRPRRCSCWPSSSARC